MSLPVTLDLGETATYELNQALLIYEAHRHGNDQRIAVTQHPVEKGVILAGQPITREAVESLAASLGRNLAAGWLPPNLVSVGFGKIAWFHPAARKRIFFKADGRFDGGPKIDNSQTARVTRLNGKVVQHPPLFFLADGRELAVFALLRNERPSATTALYRAPYWNLWQTGRMCAGSRAMPEQPLPGLIPKYEDGFFNSAFTHTNLTKVCNHAKGHAGLWEELAKVARPPAAAYWRKNLCRTNFTVSSILTTHSR